MSVTDQGLRYEADPRHIDLLMSSLDLTEANSSGTPGVKPTDRDDLASKIDEPPNTKLNDYSDPDADISAILSDANGPTRCVKHRQSSLQHCRQSQRDTWLLDTKEKDVSHAFMEYSEGP